MLRAYLRHLGGEPEHIEEAIQETAVWCCSHADEFTPGSSFGAWSRSVARFRLLAIWRDKGRADKALDESWAATIPDHTWTVLETGGQQRAQALAKCVAELPDPSRRLIDLVYQQALPVKTVAERLRATANAISMSLARLRRRLRDCVDRRVVAP
jgi:RNA polymerase sigma-70 factor (ECF subfamily)